ncbi:BTB/POZ domain-containing protein 17-like isoform X2 [Mizuhopecten yessoensis]|uniref:BTB/POZ domain-containing protein 17-like isoform X2 n=1 Tax=Mizuhopecten yessoensis TaxID=6573 RepID=UPI000B4582A2|nr:BTB/POZ domain-containing protein 17-like isoform X2 [Mizuhopecten yessoensis]XP_021371215.1 BTB/POZ domain-containing protein 17-like isoform X2 [Mizuhopecten yessoensis]
MVYIQECVYTVYRKMESQVQEEESHILRDEGNFIEDVSKFYNQEALSDVKLKVGEEVYHAHKFVLAKSSDVFRTMLYESRWSQENSSEFELSESIECQIVFDKFLRFLYTAEISIRVETAVGILCLADKYNVISLKSLCTMYMVENSKSPRVRNALSWYAWAKALGLDDLINQCAKTIAWNADSLLKLEEWSSMDFDFVNDMLHNSELVVLSEHVLYLALVAWLTDEQREDSLKVNAEKLLPLIRFPQMLVKQLYKIEHSDIMEREDCKDILHELVGNAYRYRSLCPSQTELELSFTDPFYMPRNYIDLTVDSVRMQNTLRFGIQVDVRTYAGPVPCSLREGEWKITYRKNGDCWTLQIFCHESATVNGEARVQAAVIIYNDEEKVIQVEQVPTYVCSRGNHLGLNINVDNLADSKLMALLLKPVPK